MEAELLRPIGYVRVSTNEQETGLEAQRVAIAEECRRRGWQSPFIFRDTIGGATPPDERPGLRMALHLLDAGDADTLVCAKLDRLSRSLLDFATLLERARAKRWKIVLLDFGLDMSTPVGEMVAGILASVAQFERRRIGERTKEALAVKRAAGVRLGRPPRVSVLVRDKIVLGRAVGYSFAAMAIDLNYSMGDYGPPPEGGIWTGSTVRAVYKAATKEPAEVAGSRLVNSSAGFVRSRWDGLTGAPEAAEGPSPLAPQPR